MFGGNTGNDEKSSSFFQHLGKAEKDKREYTGLGRSYGNGSRGSVNRDEIFDPSSDGVDGKLKEAALIYNIDDDDEGGGGGGGGGKDGYSFRPDVNSWGANHFPRVMLLLYATVLLEWSRIEFEVYTSSKVRVFITYVI